MDQEGSAHVTIPQITFHEYMDALEISLYAEPEPSTWVSEHAIGMDTFLYYSADGCNRSRSLSPSLG